MRLGLGVLLTLFAGDGRYLTPPHCAPVQHTESRSAEREGVRPRIAVLGHTETWQRLPVVVHGGGELLPSWARVFAATLPRTTAAMLELDFLHRARSPLEPKLRGQLRWIAAHANGCRYSEEYAAADLRRAGMDEAALRQLAGDLNAFPPDTRATLRFADKLTRDGNSVTDGEVERLIALHGERQVVAMVLLLAYATFQDRLILALGLTLDRNEPLPPVAVRFARLPLGASRMAPPRQAPPRAAETASPTRIADRDWLTLDFADIQNQLAGQRSRRCRIYLPGDNPDAPRWGLVCRAYQPELADAWSACIRAFDDEADLDPIFEESVFWIVTRSVRCFY
jgi:alkylhydroperoxidase family enzyme